MTDESHQRYVVLIVEDGVIIGTALQDELEEHGYQVAGPFDTCSAAMEYMKGGLPDAAILDVELADGTCWQLATELMRAEVPFLIYSGHMQDKTPPEFKEVEWIGKPASPATILGVLDLMMAKQQLRRDLMAEAAERRHRAAELARVSERLEQVQLPSIAAAIRDLSHYNTIRGLEQDAKAGSLKPLRRDDEG